MVHCASFKKLIHLSSLSEMALRERSDPRESESPDSSNSTSQQISLPAVRLLPNGSTDSNYSTPSRTVMPPCNATTPQGKLILKPTDFRPNGTTSTDINGHLRDLPESLPETKFSRQTQQNQLEDGNISLEHIQISNQVIPTGTVNRTPHSSTPTKRALLKSERDSREPEYRYRQPCTHKIFEDSDLPSTSRTTSHSLLKDSPFPPADSTLTSWSSVKDDLCDRTKGLQLGSSSSLGSSQTFRFSTTSSNSHPPPDSHIPSSRKSSIVLRRGTSGQYNRNRPHIHERVVSRWVIKGVDALLIVSSIKPRYNESESNCERN